MSRLIYSAICSLDGYVEDERGHFDWAEPDADVFGFINDLERSIDLYLYGRRMYETMLYWENPDDEDREAVVREFGEIWRAASKIVYSTTLTETACARTRIEHDFDPDVVRQLKASAATDISIGGADIAAQACRAGLIDEIRLFLVPASVGGGKAVLPTHALLQFELAEVRRFFSGVVYLSYDARSL